MKKIFVVMVFMFINHAVPAQGKIGINTNVPAAMLHVKDSSVIFTGLINLPVTPGNPPVSGQGIRMMWYPDKASFRAGYAAATEWDKNNIGDYSFAAGGGTKAFGDYSIAIGKFSTASGFVCAAIGNQTEASGENSLALGSLTRAFGLSSTAMGSYTNALGGYSTSMGVLTTASGDFSTAMGRGITARAFNSLAIGRYNDSIITSSRTSWIDTDPVFIIGNGTADNDRNNAFVVYKNGKTTLEGELTRPSTGSNNNLIPICYGSVSSTGTINSGTSNFLVTNSATGQYEITITNESYSSNSYATSVTVVSLSNPRMATTNASAGDLIVRIWDAAGNLVNAGFHFIVYKQ